MYYNEMILAYIYSVRCYESGALYERENEEVCEIEAHWNHRSYSLCAASDQSAQRQNSGLACLASIFPGLLGLFQLSRLTRRVVIISECSKSLAKNPYND